MFEILKEYCPSGYATRKELEKITGGVINAGTIASLDSLGRGICETKRGTKQKQYKIEDVIDWLEKNTVKQ